MVIQCVRVLFGVILVLAATAAASAQSERGSITGVVQDSTRAVLPGVAVKVVNTDTNATTTVFSADSGSYNVASLPPGVYRIEAAIMGFQSARVEGIRVAAGATARIDVTLTRARSPSRSASSQSTRRSRPRTPRSPPTSPTSRSTSCRWWWAERCAACSTSCR
jgi:hypothetical protein